MDEYLPEIRKPKFHLNCRKPNPHLAPLAQRIAGYAFATFMFILTFISIWPCLRAGAMLDRPLDPSILDTETNPAKLELELERYTVLKAKVVSIDNYKTDGVALEIEGHPDISVKAWLSQKDVAKIYPGDTVTLRGIMKYYDEDGRLLTIGSVPHQPPFSFLAQLIKVSTS